MAVINCKNCGGSIALSEDKTFGTCDFCGSTMTFPKIDDDQRAAAFNRGNHFRRIGEFDKALAVYERIVQENDQDAEAHWCCALCRFGIEYVEDPETFEWLPTCHRASFDSFLEDVDYLAAVEHSEGLTQRQYRKDAAKIAEVQRGILATSQNAEAYDVFICYKESDAEGQRTRDSLMAQDIYYQLTEQGKRVFFARITLEDVAGTQYEPYIFAALNSAKVMVVVGTKPEHFSAVWVKNEWSRFLAMMRKDRSKLLLPCYAGMDPYDLPEQLSVLQSYDMTKIGFLQDLTRGIAKVLDADKKPEPARETLVVQQAAPAANNSSALLKRGAMALEDGDWKRADEFYEEVLNQDAECGEAYLGKFLAANKVSSLDALAKARIQSLREPGTEQHTLEADPEIVAQAAEKYQIPDYLSPYEILELYNQQATYTTCAAGWQERRKQEEEFWGDQKLLDRAVKFGGEAVSEKLRCAKALVLEELDRRIGQAKLRDAKTEAAAKERLAELLRAAEGKAQSLHNKKEAQRRGLYDNMVSELENSPNATKLARLEENFKKLGNYLDSPRMLERCAALWEELRVKEQARLQAEAEARIQQAIHRKRLLKRALIVMAALAILGSSVWLLVSQVIIPSQYQKAEALMAEGNFQEAIDLFAALGDYSDSPTMVKKCKYAQAEALMAEGNFQEAIDTFASLGDYNDSSSKVQECEYAQAEALLAAGDPHGAAVRFGAAGSYRDSRSRSMELWDQIAVRDTVSTGAWHTVGLRANGTVVAVGRNDSGQRDVSGWSDIVAVSVGGHHTVGLRADGTVVAVGSNRYGQCDVYRWSDIVAVSAGSFHTVGLRADGTVVAVGSNDSGQCDVSGWSDIVAVSVGDDHTVGIRADGTVVAVGSNGFGRCDVSGWTDIVAVSAGWGHTVGLRADGTVVAVGSNGDGQCDVSGWSDIVAVSVGDWHTVGLRADGTVVAVGSNVDGQCDVDHWSGIVAISAEGYHTVGLRADGTLVAVGSNVDGQCDVSGWTDIRIPE